MLQSESNPLRMFTCPETRTEFQAKKGVQCRIHGQNVYFLCRSFTRAVSIMHCRRSLREDSHSTRRAHPNRWHIADDNDVGELRNRHANIQTLILLLFLTSSTRLCARIHQPAIRFVYTQHSFALGVPNPYLYLDSKHLVCVFVLPLASITPSGLHTSNLASDYVIILSYLLSPYFLPQIELIICRFF